MRRINAFAAAAVIAVLGTASLALAGGGGPNKAADAIWINGPSGAAGPSSPTLSYGDSFTAGFSSSASYPWAHAQCFDSSGSAFWGEWRALQADGTIGVFEITTANGGQAWPSSGAQCSLDLVSLQPKQKVLASTGFSVTS